MWWTHSASLQQNPQFLHRNVNKPLEKRVAGCLCFFPPFSLLQRDEEMRSVQIGAENKQSELHFDVISIIIKKKSRARSMEQFWFLSFVFDWNFINFMCCARYARICYIFYFYVCSICQFCAFGMVYGLHLRKYQKNRTLTSAGQLYTTACVFDQIESGRRLAWLRFFLFNLFLNWIENYGFYYCAAENGTFMFNRAQMKIMSFYDPIFTINMEINGFFFIEKLNFFFLRFFFSLFFESRDKCECLTF